MTRAGLPVPPGFTITTETCLAYKLGRRYPDGLDADVDARRSRELERLTGKTFGGGDNRCSSPSAAAPARRCRA